ncbi:hypothetical protein RDI58_015082 [Solanum bulbocastanum]|uniref:Uncharacterized protein n=1 Tax=Solanum bulbocastanum TaxID=147425 RepID=A0AAN8TJU3_SOLBU
MEYVKGGELFEKNS